MPRKSKPRRYDYVRKLKLQYYQTDTGHIVVQRGAKAILRKLVREAVTMALVAEDMHSQDSPTEREWRARRNEDGRLEADRIAKVLVP